MLLMLFFGGLVGVLVALASTVMVGREERERMQRQLAELMATVERTASVAAQNGTFRRSSRSSAQQVRVANSTFASRAATSNQPAGSHDKGDSSKGWSGVWR